jgi:RNA polymerase sigma-70 factor (ECF subfamily)
VAATASAPEFQQLLEAQRVALTGYCYRMLGSSFEAEDAVQEAFVRAWRGYERFEGRSALRSWLYRIATNVCFDMLKGRERRARPLDLGPAREPTVENLSTLPDAAWIEPAPDPAERAIARDSLRLAFIAALQHLPPRQRAALILCEVLHWQASEVARLLETSVAAVNSALQRARATLEGLEITQDDPLPPLSPEDRELLARYIDAFERYDMEALTAVVREDATQSMPPYELWLSGREDIFSFWLGPGSGCRGSRVLPAKDANGQPALAQYKPAADGNGYEPWALQVLELRDGRIVDLVFFLDTERIFPLFGLPLRLPA